ncbi:MAG: PIN domain-containing protein, partial [Bacilli bacterium]
FMNYLLDTCAVSELVKKKPNPGLVRWMDSCDEQALFLSVITLGELQKGFSKLSDEDRVKQLEAWVDGDLSQRFANRILPIDQEVMQVWGRLQGESEKRGVKLPIMDSLIAATAVVRRLVVVTRIVTDLERCQAPVHNPWEG